VVDEYLQTSHPIYSLPVTWRNLQSHPRKRLRVEHEDNAKHHGRARWRTWPAKARPTIHLPFFYSDLSISGTRRSASWTRASRPSPTGRRRFVKASCTTLNGAACEECCWEHLGQVENARKLIAEPGPLRPSDLEGRCRREPSCDGLPDERGVTSGGWCSKGWQVLIIGKSSRALSSSA